MKPKKPRPRKPRERPDLRRLAAPPPADFYRLTSSAEASAPSCAAAIC